MNRIYLIIIVLLLGACAAKKQLAEFEAQPSWMKQKPYEDGYYTGVGSAGKVGTIQQYQEAAKRDALANLAEEISVTVSSTSVLHTIETESGFSETFDQQIKISTEDYLEGFEPVEYYENDNSYWVYYRISRETYLEKKAAKKEQALNVAKVKYLDAKQEENQNNVVEAITFYLQGLESIYDYLAEDNLVELNGQTIDVGNKTYSDLNALVSSLKVSSLVEEITVKRENSLKEPILFELYYKSNKTKGIPVNFKYSGGYLNQDKGFSDENGIVKIQPGLINSGNLKEEITATIRLEEIAQNAVDNLFIRGLIGKQVPEAAIVVINIIPAGIYLSMEDDNCLDYPCDLIRSSFNEISSNNGFSLLNEKDADFILEILFSFRKGENAGGLFSSYLDGEIILKNNKGKKLWTKSLKNIEGIGRTPTSSRENAFEEFANDLNHLYLKQAFDQIKSVRL